MRVALNTNICPIIIPDTYGTDFCRIVADDMWDDFKKLMVDKAEEAIRYALDDLGTPYTSLIMGGFHSPREYNFMTDWIEFELEICDDYIANIKAAVRDNEDEFFKFAEEEFGSHPGFISFFPYEKERFYKSEDTDMILSMWIMYRMNEENDIRAYQQAYLEDVEEYANANGYFETEEE